MQAELREARTRIRRLEGKSQFICRAPKVELIIVHVHRNRRRAMGSFKPSYTLVGRITPGCSSKIKYYVQRRGRETE